jgi:cysteinyl-tRNA synthetase
VYDHAHIGHARTYTAFEVIRRWLEHRFDGKVRHVQNVTDVDDKIIQRAKERGVSPRALSAEWDARCRAVMERLGIRVPAGADGPHVTENIPQIVAFIQAIVENGDAYATPAGNVYFDVPAYEAQAQRRFPGAGYGSLSNRDYREMAAGTRKDVEADKRHPADFALWKAAEPGDHPDASWDSPWGRGRPGWHIECSLMATQALGDQIDIHGGGQDLIFPHHENEVAQSQAKTGKAPFVNFWVHTGFLNVEGEKMSKSLGNFITLEAALAELERDGWTPAALRFYFVQTHYRSKIDFSRKGLAEAARTLERLGRTRQLLADVAARGGIGCADLDGPLKAAVDAFEKDFAAAMDDDVHTPGAIAAVFALQRWANTAIDGQRADMPLGAAAARRALEALDFGGRMLALWDEAPAARSAGPDLRALAEAAARLKVDVAGRDEAGMLAGFLEARRAARTAKDWKRSDAIRDALAGCGYEVQDTPAGQRWRRL